MAKHRIVIVPGDWFGRLLVLSETRVLVAEGKVTRNRRAAICLCICGQQVVVQTKSLTTGNTRSCGCFQSETRGHRGGPGTLTAHPLYAVRNMMIQRCENPKNRDYKNYGARGISVCPEWHDTETFLAYCDTVLGPRPEGHSLDRIDPDGNYEPGNVRWADAKTQQANKRQRA